MKEEGREMVVLFSVAFNSRHKEKTLSNSPSGLEVLTEKAKKDEKAVCWLEE